MEFLGSLSRMPRLETLTLEIDRVSNFEILHLLDRPSSISRLKLVLLDGSNRPGSSFVLPANIRHVSVEVETHLTEHQFWRYLNNAVGLEEWALDFKRSRGHEQLGPMPATLDSKLTRLRVDAEELPLFDDMPGLDLRELVVSRGHYFPEDEGLEAREPPRIKGWRRRTWRGWMCLRRLRIGLVRSRAKIGGFGGRLGVFIGMRFDDIESSGMGLGRVTRFVLLGSVASVSRLLR
jgi:hypothetical protein